MKRKILSLILVLMLLPIASIFVACGKDKGYNLNSLNEDFNQIVATNNNIKNDNGKFVFDYSTHNNLLNIITNTNPYKQIENYNYVFYNLMDFAYNYVPICSNNTLVKDVQIRNKLQADLIELQKSVSDVNACVNIFAEMVTAMASTEDLTSTVCLTRFKNLISTYETMFERASVFNNTLADLYFNYILKDGNPDVFSKGVDAFEVDVVVNKLQSRLCYQKSCLSQCFVEMYVGSNLAEQIGNGATTLDITSNKYKDNIEAINDVITEETAVEKAQQNKNAFYELAVQAQNIQATIKNDTNKFITAVDKIEFCEVVVDANATAYDKLCAEIISSHNELIKDYNAVLVKMLEIII